MVKKEEELIVEYKNLIEMLETAGRGSKGITFNSSSFLNIHH